MNMEFANRLAAYRKKAGLSQEELADKLGVTRQAVSKWECGESSPDTDNLIALAKLYNVTLDELVNGENPSKEEPFIHIKGEDGEVKINGIDVNIEDDEGNEVHINKDGIKLKGKKDDDEKQDFSDEFHLLEVLTNALIPLFIIVAYLLCGFLIPNGEGWRNYWVLFFLIPILPSLMLAIKKKKFCIFVYPVLVVALYLTLGMFLGIWHPTWIMFLTIPCYYSIFGPIDAYFMKKRFKERKSKFKDDVIDNKED